MDTTEDGRARPSSLDPLDALVGRTLGDFQLRERLEGNSGFGKVYLADQPALDREAVVKVLRSQDRSGGGAQRFLREAHLASSLDHPFAAHIYAFGAEPDGLLWIAMERVRGISLDNLLATQGALPLSRFLPLMERICEVVAAAHEQGITHRDLKPANVMVLARAGHLSPKLLDFGIAKVRAGPNDAALAPAPRTESREGAGNLRAHLVDATQFGLTHPQRYVGTPHYMSPEHWEDASLADARSDIYALGVMAYQLLTGRLPFDAPSLEGLARAHAEAPLPPLGGELPAALDAVLEKATAKKPQDRFANALDFVRALTAAAGLEPSTRPLPQLSEELRELALHEGPQPVAEAVAVLEAARQLPQAIAAVGNVARVCVRYVGVLALSSRARVGGKDGAPQLPGYARLAHGGLDDVEWWELARELCRPFAHFREAHPLPELVEVFFPREGQGLSPLLPAPPETPIAAGADPAALLAQLRQGLQRLEALMQGLLFIFQYNLCVSRGDVAERWMGVRRRRRPTWEGAPGAGEGQVFLGDEHGRPVLTLSPLLQCMAPAPGASEELFFLQSQGRHGARMVALPLTFERQDDGLWSWLSENVAPLPGHETEGQGEQAAPYLGLASFSAEDAPNFIGREQEAEAFANRLREAPLLAVVGPSGSGKSSFIHAGVFPLLTDFDHVTVRPGPSPLETLIARLEQEGWGELEPDAVRVRPERLGEVLRKAAATRRAKLVLVVDQFEELLTLCGDPAEREVYARALVAATEGGPDGPIRLVLTLRDDFLLRVQGLAPFRTSLASSLHLLGTPAPEDLLRILEVPAKRAGFAFEDTELPRQMVEEVQAQPGALALLSFTASKLWELRDRHLMRLTRRAYQALGGVGGALAQHAEATLSSMSREDQPRVREAFRHLVTAEGTRAVLTRQELVQLLGERESAERVMETLIQARLLTASEGRETADRIEMVHEALLASWPRLAQWQREDAENVRMRDAIRSAARQWEERHRPKGLLWRSDALLEYRLWWARYPGALTDSEAAFASASLREESRESNLKRGLLFGLLAALVAVAAALANLNREARRSEAEIRHQLAEQYQDQGRHLLLGAEPMKALAYLESGIRLGADNEPLRFMLARSEAALRHAKTTLLHPTPLLGLHYRPDGKRLATASEDGARVWDIASGRMVLSVASGQRVWSVRFTPDGARLAAGDEGGKITLWDGETGALLASGSVCNQRVDKLYFHPSRPWLLASCFDGTAPLLDARTLAPVRPPFLPEGKARANAPTTARFSADGRWVAASTQHALELHDLQEDRTVMREKRTGGSSLVAFSPEGRWLALPERGRVRVWSLPDGRAALPLEEPDKELTLVAFNADGSEIWLMSEDSEVSVWTLAPPRRLRSHRRGRMWATVVAIDTAAGPGNEVAVLAGQDGLAQLWDAETGELRATLHGHSEPIRNAIFSPDGRMLATAALDRTARLWPVGASDFEKRLDHDAPVLQARFGAPGEALTITQNGHLRRWRLETGEVLEDRVFPAGTGEAVAAVTEDGKRFARCAFGDEVSIWDVSSPQPSRVVRLPAGFCSALGWTRDGQTLGIGMSDGQVVLHRPFSSEPPRTLGGGQDLILAVAFSPDGAWAAAAGSSGHIHLWEVATGTKRPDLSGHTAVVGGLAWSPDGQRLASVGADGHGRVWQMPKGHLLALLEDVHSVNTRVTFLASPELLATGSQAGGVEVWSARDGKRLFSFPNGGPVTDLSVSADGRWLIAGDGQGRATLWNVDRFTGTAEQVAGFTRCHVPYALEGSALISRPPRCDTP